ncbi:MAG: gliding motility-associated C-terminal domain-containing protein [Bacteroidetes bacterium]|nr:gliding motility-associated C-terminal domain-containing protein [Bacteroidota bacterium]
MQKKVYILLVFIFSFFLSFTQNTLETPKIDSVSVNHFSKKATISWYKNTTVKINGYIIYKGRVNDNTFEFLDSIKNINTTFYIDKISKPYDNIEKYRVATYDGQKYSELSSRHSTIYVYVANYDSCNANITINWNSYKNWEAGVKNYKIYYSINKSDYKLLASVEDDTTYTQNNLQREKQYSYYVMATSNDGKTSSSNEAFRITNMPKPPQYVDINSVNIVNNNSVNLSYHIDLNADITSYKLLRSDNSINNFDTIYTFTDFSDPLEYRDKEVDIKKQYYYKLIAVNTCHLNTDSSEIVSNIVLNTKNSHDSLKNNLQWNILFKKESESYSIYRIIDDGDTNLIANTEETSYTDNISNYIQSKIQGKFCYYIEAQINYTGNFELSKSNITCVYQMPIVYIANAFSPNSNIQENRKFCPAISFASPSKYSFIIYNRWGEKIFETKDSQQAWYGRYKGEPVQEGSYMYYIKFYTSKNKLYQKNGHVTVFYH